MCPTLGHSMLCPPGLAPSTLAMQGDLLSLVPLDSPDRESHMVELHSLSTPDTFKATQDLIAMMAQLFSTKREEQEVRPPAPQTMVVLYRGKPAMTWHRSPTPQHHFPDLSCSAPLWSLQSDSQSSGSEAEPYVSRHSWHWLQRCDQRQEQGQNPLMEPWQAQWPVLLQWPF